MARAGERSLRREPVQRRGLERRQLILDVAARLIEEQGPEHLSTVRIAQAAGVSVGSLYQYFADRDAILDALVDRYLESLAATLEGLFARRSFAGWEEAIDAAVDAFVRFYRSEPGFTALWVGGCRTPAQLARDDANDLRVAGTLRRLLAERGLIPDDPALELPVLLAWKVGGTVLAYAFRRRRGGDRAVAAELKRLLRGYLGSVLGS